MKIVANKIAKQNRLLDILMSLKRCRFGVDDFYPHAVMQLHVAGQRDQILRIKPAYDLVVHGIRDSQLNFALLQYFLADAQPRAFYHVDKSLAAFGSDRTARYNENIGSLLRIDAHTDVYVG